LFIYWFVHLSQPYIRIELKKKNIEHPHIYKSKEKKRGKEDR